MSKSVRKKNTGTSNTKRKVSTNGTKKVSNSKKKNSKVNITKKIDLEKLYDTGVVEMPRKNIPKKESVSATREEKYKDVQSEVKKSKTEVQK